MCSTGIAPLILPSRFHENTHHPLASLVDRPPARVFNPGSHSALSYPLHKLSRVSSSSLSRSLFKSTTANILAIVHIHPGFICHAFSLSQSRCIFLTNMLKLSLRVPFCFSHELDYCPQLYRTMYSLGFHDSHLHLNDPVYPGRFHLRISMSMCRFLSSMLFK